MVSTDSEWSLQVKIFEKISSCWGPFDIDLFALAINYKTSVYVSWIQDPGSYAVNAFTLSWANLNFYAFPSFILLPRVKERSLMIKQREQ